MVKIHIPFFENQKLVEDVEPYEILDIQRGRIKALYFLYSISSSHFVSFSFFLPKYASYAKPRDIRTQGVYEPSCLPLCDLKKKNSYMLLKQKKN